MALLKQQPMDEMVDDLVADADNDELSISGSIYRMWSKFALGIMIKGFMAGVGVFFGSLLSHYYVLPHLNLQYYSLFLIKLHELDK